MRAVFAAIALCAGLAGPRRARADGDDREAAGSVVVGGGAEDHDRMVVSAAVAVAAREAGWSIREPVSRQDAERLVECGEPATPWACVPPSIGSRGIRRLFVFAVDQKQADNGAPMVVLTARLIVIAPRALVVRQRFCEHCADDRLTEASIDLARQLLQDLAVRTGRTVLEVASKPPGARITLDGQPIGATDASFNTYPGAHVVVIDRPGFRAQTRSVIAEEGKTSSVAVALAPAEPAAAPASHRFALALAGGGVLAVAAAGALIELGARDGPDDKYRYTGATPAGLVIGTVGLTAIGAAVYQWWSWRGAPAATAPAVGISAHGLTAGWTLAF